VRGPMMGAVTMGLESSQASAMCAGSCTEVLVDCELRAILLNSSLCTGTGTTTHFSFPQNTSEQSTGERTPGNNAKAISLAGGEHLEFNCTRVEVVETLFRDKPEEMTIACALVRTRDMPASKVTAANINDFALANELFHSLPDLFPGSLTVDMVHLVEIDTIRLEPTKTIFASVTDVQGRETRLVRPGAHDIVDFGRQDDVITPVTTVRTSDQ